jgi:hypothetical protein
VVTETFWREEAEKAARNLPDGRIGGVIAQLRDCGRIADRRARVFLGFLLVTVIAGLAYYVGRPIWADLADGTRRTWEAQIAAAEADITALDARRAEAVAALSAALALSPEVARSADGSEEGFFAPVVLADGTLVATGESGTILRSEDGGRSWAEVRARSPDAEGFSAPVVLADGSLVATGLSGTILRLSGDAQARLAEIAPAPGGAGDAVLESFGAALDAEVRRAEPVAVALAAIQAIAAERKPVEAGLARARARCRSAGSGAHARPAVRRGAAC